MGASASEALTESFKTAVKRAYDYNRTDIEAYPDILRNQLANVFNAALLPVYGTIYVCILAVLAYIKINSDISWIATIVIALIAGVVVVDMGLLSWYLLNKEEDKLVNTFKKTMIDPYLSPDFETYMNKCTFNGLVYTCDASNNSS